MPIVAIEPRRLYRQVAEQLRQLIDRGELPVGSRLPAERDLAAQLGVSRPTVREALIALEVDGRIKIRVGSGIYVLPPPARSAAAIPVAGPFEILEARALFEGAVAAEAARLATPVQIAELGRHVAAMRSVQHSGEASVAADRAFHVAIADILNNDAITKVVADLFDQRINPYFEALARYFETPTSWRQAVHEIVCSARGSPLATVPARKPP